MADDKNVISFAERQRAKAGQQGPEKLAAESADQPAAGDLAPVPARLAWLYCPTCKTLEYTEMMVHGGRVHNVCGTTVQEAVVDVDARAEYTVAELNLRRLEALARLVDAQRARQGEFQARLRKAAGKPLTAYPANEATLRALPVAEADALGLLVSTFLHDPARRFGGPPEDAPKEESTDARPGPSAQDPDPAKG